jgi:hypothetical protein
MFERGDVILAPCRGDRGEELAPHWRVVLEVNPENGMIAAVFTTSVKEGLRGGQFAFTDEECKVAGFAKPCRFDPNRVCLYAKEVQHLISRPAGRLTKKMLSRIVMAVLQRSPEPTEYKIPH